MPNQHFSTLPVLSLNAIEKHDEVSVIDLRTVTEIPIFTGTVKNMFEVEERTTHTRTRLTIPKVVVRSETHQVEYFASDIGLCPDPYKCYSPHIFTVQAGDEPDTHTLKELARMKLQLPYRKPVMVWSKHFLQ